MTKFFTDLYNRVVNYADKHGRVVLAVATAALLILNPIFTLFAAIAFVAYVYIKNETA
jgi:hypothetical protein